MPPRAETVLHRVYADFLMPSRLDAYRGMLRSFLDAGYVLVTIGTLWNAIVRGRLDPAARYVVVRHDVDTDPGTARRMWAIERDLGVNGSYFFRLSTLDIPLMQAIAGSGGEASYHYEEIATIAKARRVRSADALRGDLDEARSLFAHNLERLRSRTGLSMEVVASHGDFVNRRLGLPNWEILADEAFRAEVRVDLETYDTAFMSHVTSRHADTLHPKYWVGEDPAAAIARNEPVVYVLVHPRHWRVARVINARDDVTRALESLRYERGLPI